MFSKLWFKVWVITAKPKSLFFFIPLEPAKHVALSIFYTIDTIRHRPFGADGFKDDGIAEIDGGGHCVVRANFDVLFGIEAMRVALSVVLSS